MPNYSFNSIVMLLFSVTSGPLGLWMDGTEMVGVEMGSISDGCCMCVRTAMFNSGGKGGGWSKASRGFHFWAELFTSTSEHLRLKRWGQVLVLNVIRVDCWWCCCCRSCLTSCGCSRVLCLRWKALQNALHLLLHFVRPVDEVVLQLASLLHDQFLPFPEPC